MRVYYHSALEDKEIASGSVLRTVPCKARIELQREKADAACEILYNGTIINPDTKDIECVEETDLVIRQSGRKDTYSIRHSIHPLPEKYARAYEQFSYEYREADMDEISSIQLGSLKLYAVDQSAEVYDYTDVFDQIETAYSAFKLICERPKSHLKAVNEVRPIETVKRIGYESIPYLAAHSEDWLARTASGLKPARLFSRVEEDEFQIYENRVVKTLIDLIIGFLRKTEKQLRDQRDQLRGIMNSSVQTGSFGFDVTFQKAVSELMSSDSKGEEYRSKSLELVEKLQHRAYYLLKRYRTLRQTRLYRYLRKARHVSNPLNETNILVLDKHYSVIFKLWKTIHHVIAPRALEEENQVAFDDTCDDYQQFCSSLCGYAAHVLGFELLENGHYVRENDHLDLTVSCEEDGLIDVILKDVEPRTVVVPPAVDVPDVGDTNKYRISYDGRALIWPNDITVDEIDAFCSLFKTRESRGREQNEEKRKYAALKTLLDEANRSYNKPAAKEFVIIPLAVELETEARASFRALMETVAGEFIESKPEAEIVVALPICNENEQKITEYAREDGQIVSILPLTMFDINSFRRLQNMLYRQILKMEKTSCPNCGGKMRIHENRRVCDDCNQLTLTRTICPNPECKQEYLYMEYDVPETTLLKMQRINSESFFEWDSLFQYKNIVNMTVQNGKLRTVCPCCHQS